MTEKQLHKQICTYLKMQYPKALFNTDMSGLKLTIGQSVQAKQLRSNNGFPDIVIYENCTIIKDGKYPEIYSALFLEVKKETPFKKNGILKKNKHLFEQQQMINQLNTKKYKAAFVWSFDMAKTIIDNYLM